MPIRKLVRELHTCKPKLTHWGRVTHICVGKLTIIGSDNGLSPGRRQAIIWTNVGILLIWPLGTNFSEILIANETFSFKKMHLKKSSAKWCPFCLSLNVLKGSDRGEVNDTDSAWAIRKTNADKDLQVIIASLRINELFNGLLKKSWWCHY